MWGEKVDSKGKVKMDPVDEFNFHYILQNLSFDLGVGSVQPNLLEVIKSKEV